MKMTKRILLLVLACLLLTSVAVNAGSEAPDLAEHGLPLVEEQVTLSIFHRMDGGQWFHYSDMQQAPIIQYLEEITNIDLEFVIPPNGEEFEALSLLLATRQLPDIIQYDLFRFAGGPSKMLEDGIIIPLNDLVNEYAPDYLNVINENEARQKQTKTDDGVIFGFHTINDQPLVVDGETLGRGSRGMIANLTLIEAAGWTDVPRTIEEYDQLCKDIKAMDPSVYPFFVVPDLLSGAWGFILGDPWSSYDYFNKTEDNVVVFGPLHENYYAYLEQMRDWYDEGILHPEFPAWERETLTSFILNNELVFSEGYSSGAVSNTNTSKGTDTPLEFVPVPWPTSELAPNGIVTYGEYIAGVGTWTATITADCENPVEAVKWLNFGYSDYGHTLMIWGIEDVDYYIGEDGEKYFTEPYIQAMQGTHPDGYTFSQARALSSLAQWWPNVKEPRANNYSLVVPDVDPYRDLSLSFLKTYGVASVNNLLPGALTLTAEESSRFANIVNEALTYVNETRNQFIMGVKPLNEETYAQYVSTLESMGIHDAIAIQQAALDRYNNR